MQNRVVNIAHASYKGNVKAKALVLETVSSPYVDYLTGKTVSEPFDMSGTYIF